MSCREGEGKTHRITAFRMILAPSRRIPLPRVDLFSGCDSCLIMQTAPTRRSWEEICADPLLRNLPYKVETNARGQIIMTPPARNEHSAFQSRIASLLERLLPHGCVFTEAATETNDGTKAADVAWTTREHAKAEIKHASWQHSPALIVEVWSPHNFDAEMAERRALFFRAGAEEFWTCDLDGRMRFWTRNGERERSRCCPEFPREIVLFGSDA